MCRFRGCRSSASKRRDEIKSGNGDPDSGIAERDEATAFHASSNAMIAAPPTTATVTETHSARLNSPASPQRTPSFARNLLLTNPVWTAPLPELQVPLNPFIVLGSPPCAAAPVTATDAATARAPTLKAVDFQPEEKAEDQGVVDLRRLQVDSSSVCSSSCWSLPQLEDIASWIGEHATSGVSSTAKQGAFF